MSRLLFFFPALLLLASCARSFKSINYQVLNYRTTIHSSDALEIRAAQDVLALTDNVQFHNRAVKDNVKVMAVEITNRTEKNLSVGKDLRFEDNVGYSQRPVGAMEAYDAVRYHEIGWYWTYGCIPFINLNLNTTNNTTCILIPFGVILAPLNYFKANKANKDLRREFLEMGLCHSNIPAQSKTYGLLFFKMN